ncbi:FHA domain-containing protein [Anaerolineales bacterium HSG6]|nr:FHA domain-containing protein [Anaerolineales bacterium HSG6]MDM8529966.1 FHA domain-containing protein [Anaerolineales bacterium HSG25]
MSFHKNVSFDEHDLFASHPGRRRSETTEIIEPTSEKSSLHLAWLIIVNGPDVGKIYEINQETIEIGRSAECDLVIQDKSVSRRHIQIRGQTDKSHYMLIDLGSGNGTVVNGQKVTQHVLQDEDFILVGRTECIFKQLTMKNKLLYGS